MLDFHVCSWGEGSGLSAHDDSLARHFDGLNDPAFSAALQVGWVAGAGRVVGAGRQLAGWLFEAE